MNATNHFRTFLIVAALAGSALAAPRSENWSAGNGLIGLDARTRANGESSSYRDLVESSVSADATVLGRKRSLIDYEARGEGYTYGNFGSAYAQMRLRVGGLTLVNSAQGGGEWNASHTRSVLDEGDSIPVGGFSVSVRARVGTSCALNQSVHAWAPYLPAPAHATRSRGASMSGAVSTRSDGTVTAVINLVVFRVRVVGDLELMDAELDAFGEYVAIPSPNPLFAPRILSAGHCLAEAGLHGVIRLERRGVDSTVRIVLDHISIRLKWGFIPIPTYREFASREIYRNSTPGKGVDLAGVRPDKNVTLEAPADGSTSLTNLSSISKSK